LPRISVLITLLLASTVMVGLTGCQTQRPGSDDYRTVDDAPRRDTDKARRLNDQALRAIEKGRYNSARKKLERALESDVTFGPAHNNLGLVHFQNKRLYRAAWEFQYAIKLMPDKARPKNNLGLVYETVGKMDKAVDQYKQAKKIAPDNPQIIGNLARARIRRGETDKSLKKLLESLVMKDNRKRWVRWARKQLTRFNDINTKEP